MRCFFLDVLVLMEDVDVLVEEAVLFVLFSVLLTVGFFRGIVVECLDHEEWCFVFVGKGKMDKIITSKERNMELNGIK